MMARQKIMHMQNCADRYIDLCLLPQSSFNKLFDNSVSDTGFHAFCGLRRSGKEG